MIYHINYITIKTWPTKCGEFEGQAGLIRLFMWLDPHICWFSGTCGCWKHVSCLFLFYQDNTVSLWHWLYWSYDRDNVQNVEELFEVWNYFRTPCGFTVIIGDGWWSYLHCTTKVTILVKQLQLPPRQWTDHWQHCRGGRQALVNTCKSAPPAISFDAPVAGMLPPSM